VSVEKFKALWLLNNTMAVTLASFFIAIIRDFFHLTAICLSPIDKTHSNIMIA
jgi:hypothetical protein